MSWILPNAKFNNVTLDTAWFIPHPLPTLAPSRPELLPEEDEEGMLETVAYFESLIDACVAAGIPPNRIVLGGFSQGCAMSLLWFLTTSKYSDKLAGIVGLLGFLPLSDGRHRIQELRSESGLAAVPPKVPLFLARGTKDSLITNRVWNYSLQGLKDLGIEDSEMEIHVYPGLEHTIHGPLLRDMCAWLEKTLPELES
jgi:lysophospholipase-2